MTGLAPRIGYVPYSRDLSHPADARRFPFYAKKRGLEFEIADPKSRYDVVILSERADVSVWSRYPRSRGRIIYELLDSYLAVPNHSVKALLRGAAKFGARENKYPRLNHRKALEEMCARSDAVICSTAEQSEKIREHCANVHVILDIHSAVVRARKSDYRAGEAVHIVWEGFPENLSGFADLRHVLRDVGRGRNLALHLVTDLKYFQFMGRFFERDTAARACKIYPRTFLHEWNAQTFSQIVVGCDLAIIPVNLGDPFARGKPANKLLLFWRMGMPAVVSATPSYEAAMREANLAMACRTKSDWKHVLQAYLDDESARREAGLRGLELAESLYGEDVMIRRWDRALASVLG